ncbi:hypothetical protein TKK_0018435 [Trichogramma kaykai]
MDPTRSNQQEASVSCSWNGSLPKGGKIRQFPRKFKKCPNDKAAIVLDKVPGLELVEYIIAVEAAVSPAMVDWADELEPSQVCLFLTDVTAAQNSHGVFLNVAGHRLRARALTDPPLVRVLVTNASPLIDNETIEWHLLRNHDIKVKNWVHLEAKPSPNPNAQPRHNVLCFARHFYIEAHCVPKLPAKIEGRAHDKSYTIYFGSEDHWCDFCHRVGHYEWSCSKPLMARSIGLSQRPTIPVANGTAPVENNAATRSNPSSRGSTPRKNLGVYYDDTKQTTTPTTKTRVASPVAGINGRDRLAPPCTPPKQLVATGEDLVGAFGLRFVLAQSDEKSPRQVQNVQVIPLPQNQNSPSRGSNSSQPSATRSPVDDHADGTAAAEAAAAAAEAATAAETAAAAAKAAAATASSAAVAAAASAASATARAASADEAAEVAVEASVDAVAAANYPASPRKDSSTSMSSNPSCTSSLKKKIRNQMSKNNKNNKKNKKPSVVPSPSRLYTKASEKKTAAVQPGPSGTSTAQITPAPLPTTPSPSTAAGASVAAGPSSSRTDTTNDSSTNPPIVGAIEIHPPPAMERPMTIEESTARHELPVQLQQPGETDEAQATSPRSSHASPARSDGSVLRLTPATPKSPRNASGSPSAEPNSSKSPSGSKQGKRSLKAAFQRLL